MRRRLPGLEELRRDGHGVAAGLEDHGVAADDRGHGHAGEDGQGEIPGRDDRADAEREVAQFAALAGELHRGRGFGEAQRFAGVELDEVDGFGHFGVGLGEVLADLEDEPGRPLEFMVAQGVGYAEEKIGALLNRGVLPALEGLERGIHGGGHIFGFGLLEDAHDLVGIRGVERLQFGGGALAMAADDVVVFAAQLAAHPFQRLAHGALVFRALEVQSGLVAEGRVCGIWKPDRFHRALYSRHDDLSMYKARIPRQSRYARRAELAGILPRAGSDSSTGN